MMFSIDHRFGFTNETHQKLGVYSVQHLRFPGELQLAPLVGDLVRIPGPGVESHTFVVIGREFSYLETDKIEITYLLDLADEKAQRPELRRIK